MTGEASREREPERIGGRPPLSVVVATLQPWPELRPCLDTLADQARRLGAELLVVDGDGHGLPDEGYAGATHVPAPGAGIFRLRGIGANRARGEIVAITEDHCRVAPDWCERILAAHQAHSRAAAIGGAVENAATSRAIDWASFLIVNGPFMQPLRSGRASRISLQANVSYKRHALAAVGGQGLMEMLHNAELAQAGEELRTDDSILVWHDQSLGVAGTCAAHFHNGRSIAGFRLDRIGPAERALRLGATPILPLVMLARIAAMMMRKGRLIDRALAGAPWMAVLLACHAAGEAVGYVAGPGDSPRRLR